MALKVKPLDWRPADSGGIWAYNEVTGTYKIIAHEDQFIALGLGPFLTEEKAIAYCQSCHDRKILSCIDLENSTLP